MKNHLDLPPALGFALSRSSSKESIPEKENVRPHKRKLHHLRTKMHRADKVHFSLIFNIPGTHQRYIRSFTSVFAEKTGLEVTAEDNLYLGSKAVFKKKVPNFLP
jgi:hypothetical protein